MLPKKVIPPKNFAGSIVWTSTKNEYNPQNAIWSWTARPWVFWLSVTRNLRKAQRWNKSVLTSDRCRPHSLTFGLFEPGKYLWELSACVPYIGIPCQCIRFDMSNAADTNSLDRRSEGIITVFKKILHVQRLRYFERKQTQQKTVFWKWIKRIKTIFMPITSSEIPWTFFFLLMYTKWI